MSSGGHGQDNAGGQKAAHVERLPFDPGSWGYYLATTRTGEEFLQPTNCTIDTTWHAHGSGGVRPGPAAEHAHRSPQPLDA